MNSEKLTFTFEETGETVEFYVLEQTKVNGYSYLLIADSKEGDGECMILKDTSSPKDEDSIFEIVDNDVELEAVRKVFEELLEDVDIEM